MSFRNQITEKLIFPLSDIVLGSSVSNHLKFLQKSQHWTRDQIDDYQNQRLRKLIHHSYENVPFYRELFDSLKLKPDDIQTKDDLKKLPIVTKDDLRRNKGKHFASNIKKSQLVFSSSSGSTGEPFRFYKTKYSDSVNKAAALRGWYWMGYNLGDLYAKISMNPRSSLNKKMQDFVNNSLYLSSTQLTYIEFKKIVLLLLKKDPWFIRCYPTPLLFLSRQYEKIAEGVKSSSLKAINTTGSTLSLKVREEVERIFGVKIFDSYSCEGGGMFYECPTHSFYHPSEETAIQEYIEDSFTLTDSERPVRHITTDLNNYASPFIRYDTQDYVILGSDELCSCGRHFRNIKSIKGRDSDILITPSGKYLIVENFVAYFEWIDEVDQIQVLQNKRDEIIIKMIVNNRFSKSVFSKVLEYWKSYIGSDVEVVLEVVKEIKLTPTGKRRTVIRNPEIKIDDGI
jgi:phenylacetate-CoA ligase